MDAGTAEGSLMVAFMRRFDDSYRDAYTKMKAGAIGEPLIYRSHSCDRAIDSPAFREYLVTSGGIFTDATIHDIDLSLMFLGDDSIPKSAYAVGMAAKYKELEAVGDVDNGIGIVEFWSGRIAYYYESRTSAHGFDNVCELWGTDGKLMVNSTPRKNRVQLCGRDGYTKVEPDLTWYDRYVPAYVDEANTWVDAILDAEPLPIPLRSSLKSLIIANGLMESLRTGRKVEFTKEGNPMPA
jgi:myo-inositol 2-dehydrogenase/D-chiro-inositol 1-dehydrogenase